MTIEKLTNENGTATFEGKTYILIQQAYIDGPIDSPFYVASAICPSDGLEDDGLYNVYTITWLPLQEWLDSDRDDEGWACDWDMPDSVEKISCGYDLAAGRVI